jgi:lycopene cyclase domain-containing protein
MTYLYLGLLAGCLLTTLPLERWLRVRVYARWRRLLITVLPVAAVFLGWDAAAVAAHHWRYDRHQTLSVRLPGQLPVEELVFFIVIPICAVCSFEAVRAVRGWPVGDE